MGKIIRKIIKDNSCRKFLATSVFFSFRETDRPPLDTDIRALDSGSDALLVQLLAGLGRDSWSSGSSGHKYAYTGDDVHRTQERHSASGIHQSEFANVLQQSYLRALCIV